MAFTLGHSRARGQSEEDGSAAFRKQIFAFCRKRSGCRPICAGSDIEFLRPGGGGLVVQEPAGTRMPLQCRPDRSVWHGRNGWLWYDRTQSGRRRQHGGRIRRIRGDANHIGCRGKQGLKLFAIARYRDGSQTAHVKASHEGSAEARPCSKTIAEPLICIISFMRIACVVA